MGSLASRQSSRNEETDTTYNHMYRYPAKSGNYFANYFIMGGEKFDALQPEAYLFGDNMDLNFLGSRPVPFPYPAPQTKDPIRPLKSLVNIRKESVRFVRVNGSDKSSYSIEFTFDTDVRCSITIYYFCTEEITSNGVLYHPKDEKLTSEIYYYKRGTNQQFVQTEHVFDPVPYSDDDLFFNIDKDVIPVAIQCIALEGPDDARQSHTTIAVIERHSDGSFSLKALKQKLFVDGLCYLLQEVYGIENKINEINKETNDDEIEDGGLECVICMSDMRDTLILPCRHLCLCQACADSLRYQANNCPICRSPFRALLQIKALRKCSGQTVVTNETGEGIPVGFEHVSLIETLNGPAFTKRLSTVAPSGDALLDVTDLAAVMGLNPAMLRKKCSEQIVKTLRTKPNIIANKEPCDGEIESKDNVYPISLGKLASHDTEDEDKSSSITDHLLHDKPSLCSPDTVHHINEISSTEDEMPDEDSEAEKLSPLLEVVTFENNGTSRIEISITSPKSESSKCSSSNLAESNASSRRNSLEVVNGEKVGTLNRNAEPRNMKYSYSTTEFTGDSLEEHTEAIMDSQNSHSLTSDKEQSSQPGTPASVASLRSSDDSYSSSGSSRRLLSPHEKPTLV